MIWQWSMRGAESVHLPGLGVLYFQEQGAEPLAEPLLLSLLCRSQWIWGFQVPWKNWRAGVGVEMAAKGSNSVCALAAVGVIIELSGPLSELFADNPTTNSEDL